MPNTPAKATKKTVAKPDSDITLIGEVDTDDESYTAKVFDGEEFTFSTDINAYLLLTATRGGDEFIRLMDSLVLVDTDGAKDQSEIDARTEAERERFHGVLARQKHLSIERLATFVGEMMEIAGNEDGDSSSTD